MSNEDDIKKALCRTLAEIAKREKKKSIQFGNYWDALLAGFAEGFFTKAEKSF
ncbi:MAG: hypothetical protein PVF15_10525 [Candidatus Bathyarchaeota archaeon]